MYRYRFVSALALAAALLAPVSALAAVAAPQVKVAVQLKVYDRSHKDYHVWDDQEDATYRKYLNDHHMKYRGISSLSARQQTNYWNYRHTPATK